MAISIRDVQIPLTVTEVKTMLLTKLTDLGFPVTSWQDKGIARSFVEAAAQYGADISIRVAELANAPFLQTAKGETLTRLVKSHYDEDRAAGIRSIFTVTLVNAGGVNHTISNPNTIRLKANNSATFSNTSTGTISANASTVFTFQADIAGASGNVSAQFLQMVTPYAGVTADYDGNLGTAGADPESDIALAEHASSKWGTLRVEKVRDGILNLARDVVPTIHSVGVDDANPRGPGTVDVYLASLNATAGTSDVSAVQAALDQAIFGNGTSDLVKAFASPTQIFNIVATIYYRGVDPVDLENDLNAAFRQFLADTPIGGYDLSPGPTNVITKDQLGEYLNAVTGAVSLRITSPTAFESAITQNHKVIEGTITWNLIPLRR